MMTAKKNGVKIGAVLLAAGSSSRLGQSKQMLKIGEETLLQRTLRTLMNADLHVVLTVLGSNADQHLATIEGKSNEIIINKDWQRGMGNSLKVGLDALLELHTDLDAVLVSVCDQPHLSTDHVNELVNKYFDHQDKIVASSYQGVWGVPALFPERLFNTLMVIPDNAGAKKIILEHADDLIEVLMDKGEVDIDLPEDLDMLEF